MGDYLNSAVIVAVISSIGMWLTWWSSQRGARVEREDNVAAREIEKQRDEWDRLTQENERLQATLDRERTAHTSDQAARARACSKLITDLTDVIRTLRGVVLDEVQHAAADDALEDANDHLRDHLRDIDDEGGFGP